MMIQQHDALMGGGRFKHNELTHKFDHIWRYLHLYDIMDLQLMSAPQNYGDSHQTVFSSRRVER